LPERKHGSGDLSFCWEIDAKKDGGRERERERERERGREGGVWGWGRKEGNASNKRYGN